MRVMGYESRPLCFSRNTRHETRITAFMFFTNHESRITDFMAVGAQGSHNNKPPPGLPLPKPGQCFPAHFCPELPGSFFSCLPAHDCSPLLGIARHCSAFLQPGQCFPAHYYPLLPGFARLCSAKNIAPEPVSAHRQPFSAGLTTSAVRGSSRRPPGFYRCGQGQMNPCGERGTFWIAQTGNFRYCVDTPRRGV